MYLFVNVNLKINLIINSVNIIFVYRLISLFKEIFHWFFLFLGQDFLSVRVYLKIALRLL